MKRWLLCICFCWMGCSLLAQPYFERFFSNLNSQGGVAAVERPEGGYYLIAAHHKPGQISTGTAFYVLDEYGISIRDTYQIYWGIAEPADMVMLPNGNLLVAGAYGPYERPTSPRPYFQVFSPEGEELSRTVIDSFENIPAGWTPGGEFWDILALQDGGYLLTGAMSLSDFPQFDREMLAVKLNADLETEWVFREPGIEWAYGQAAEETENGDLFLCGNHSTSGTTLKEVIIVRLNKWGVKLGHTVIAESGGGVNVSSIKAYRHGQLLVSGVHNLDGQQNTGYWMLLDSNLNFGNRNIIVPENASYSSVKDIKVIGHNRFYLFGNYTKSTGGGTFLAEIINDSLVKWHALFGDYKSGYRFVQTEGNDFVLTGTGNDQSNGPLNDVWFVRTNCIGTFDTLAINYNPGLKFDLYPNPIYETARLGVLNHADSFCKLNGLELNLFDTQGRLVPLSYRIKGLEAVLSIEHLSPGFYLLRGKLQGEIVQHIKLLVR